MLIDVIKFCGEKAFNLELHDKYILSFCSTSYVYSFSDQKRSEKSLERYKVTVSNNLRPKIRVKVGLDLDTPHKRQTLLAAQYESTPEKFIIIKKPSL